MPQPPSRSNLRIRAAESAGLRGFVRHALALCTVAVFTWFGLVSLALPLTKEPVLGVRPSVGHILLALAGLRLMVWLRGLWRRRSSD